MSRKCLLVSSAECSKLRRIVTTKFRYTSQAPQILFLKEADANGDRGQTVYWNKRMKKRKRRRTELTIQKNAISEPHLPDAVELAGAADSDSSGGTSSTSSSPKSSSSTELCDDDDAAAELDSEDANTSVSEHGCGSPRSRLRTSDLSLVGDAGDDDLATKADSERRHSPGHEAPKLRAASSETTLPPPSTASTSRLFVDEPAAYCSADDDRHILNVLLTTSIIANEHLDEERVDCSPGHLRGDDAAVPDEAPKPNGLAEATESLAADLDVALEHMKIDALEILLSSRTLESIRNHDASGQPVDDGGRGRSGGGDDDEADVAFRVNRETEIALQRILFENTEVLKKMNQGYSSLESRCSDTSADDKTSLPEAATGDRIELPDSALAVRPLGRTNGVCRKYEGPEPACGSVDWRRAEYWRPADGDDRTATDGRSWSASFENGDESARPEDRVPDDSSGGDCLPNSASRRSPPSSLAAEVTARLNELRVRPSPPSSNGRHPVMGRTDDETDESTEALVAAAATTAAVRAGKRKKKYKSLDNLYVRPKSKLKIGVFGGAGDKWISISIDNSDLVVANRTPESVVAATKTEAGDRRLAVARDARRRCAVERPVVDPYLHLNFDIIAASGKKKRDPIEQYAHKKSLMSQNFRPPELTAINFNPFPSKPQNRPPKELGVKLGLYSAGKK